MKNGFPKTLTDPNIVNGGCKIAAAVFLHHHNRLWVSGYIARYYSIFTNSIFLFACFLLTVCIHHDKISVI